MSLRFQKISYRNPPHRHFERSGHQFVNKGTLLRHSLSIDHKVASEKRSQSENSIRDRTLVDLY